MSTEGNEISIFVHLPNVGAVGVMDEDRLLLKPILFINGKITPMPIDGQLLSESNRGRGNQENE